jgi:hypothetical protein
MLNDTASEYDCPSECEVCRTQKLSRLGFFGRRQQGTFTQLHMLSSLIRRGLVRTEIDIRWVGAIVNGDMSNKFDTQLEKSRSTTPNQFRNTPER